MRLMARSRAVEAKALAESKAVTIALEDHSLNEKLSTADVLDVGGNTEALARVACKSPKARRATRARSEGGEILFSDELGTGVPSALRIRPSPVIGIFLAADGQIFLIGKICASGGAIRV